ncbi:hypothetical protein ACWT_3931 [Actinoplanes sp. SE50]|nr:hypothetical protein ACPL_4060 [Actinoplanes sp. SE50/110]ATO83346.1 hypothetical protein ACWT_3931 [Actinoplanes sp. SE50]SLM00753.1 hypothetical protein ACSP50_3986 [Actinoplanes sp. SE50/110]
MGEPGEARTPQLLSLARLVRGLIGEEPAHG